MTFLFWDEVGVLEVVRQKGDAELYVVLVMIAWTVFSQGRRTRNGLGTGKRHVSYPIRYDARCSSKGHEPTWTISCQFS